jgi:glycerol kinase
LTTIAWEIDGEVTYALEGSVFVAGAVVQWLRDSLGIINTSAEIELLATKVPDSGGVYFVPAFAGLGTPYWDQDARALIIGMTRGTTKAHIARAALEAIAFQTVDLISAMREDSRSPIDELRVDGGATENSLLMQLQADLLQVPVARSHMNETTALGAAYLAGLACGFWADTAELAAHEAVLQRFYPSITANEAATSIERWHDAVSRSLGWAADDEK